MKRKELLHLAFHLSALSIILLQQISVPQINNIQIITPIIIAIGAALILTGAAKVQNSKLLATAYIFATISTLISIIKNPDIISLQSYIYFAALYLIFFVRPTKENNLIEKLPSIGILFSAIGIGQLLAQYIGIPFFDVRSIAPESTIIQNYNYSYETSYNSGIFKPNGATFLEPSFFSQFMALFLIVEYHNKRRALFLATFALSILASHSGTGIIILLFWAISFPIFINPMRTSSIIGLMLPIAAVLIALGQSEYLYTRALEITREESSAHIRFIAPLLNYQALIDSTGIATLLFGAGPGSSENIILTYQANYSAFFKAIFEYGLFFSLSYVFWWAIFLKRNAPNYLFAPLFAFIFIASGSFLQPLTLLAAWFFCFFASPTCQQRTLQPRPCNQLVI
ncbi:hypothetical protein [Metapseudomonas boanensis]|uniref:Uncharacterized protein n=1 Tax=Metapseudomonas boanensis TaxID=2822138 RepID=A0ABS5XER6_9GAMM|nr:hypothetical protein [Pseudomonas boanensis]MBT8765773.1 hypothetical protein [Pseudomonas boanensis]